MNTEQIMALADAYAAADACEQHAIDFGSDQDFDAAIKRKQEARAALEAALTEKQDQRIAELEAELSAYKHPFEPSERKKMQDALDVALEALIDARESTLGPKSAIALYDDAIAKLKEVRR